MNEMMMRFLKSKILIFLTMIFLLFISCNSLQIIKGFTLLDNNIFIVSDQGIYLYNFATGLQLINDSCKVSTDEESKYFSLIQFPLEDGGYIILRANEKIYVYNQSINVIGDALTLSEINTILCSIVPYISNGIKKIIISCLSGGQKIQLYMCPINSGIGNCFEKVEESSSLRFQFSTISCQLMSSNNYSNKLLTCFAISQSSSTIMSITFNPEDSLNLVNSSDSLSKAQNQPTIYSTVSENFKNSLVCFTSMNLYCFTY